MDEADLPAVRDPSPAREDEDLPGLEELLEGLKLARGCDLTGYKRATLARRIRRRMAAVGIEDFAAYARHVDRTPDEHSELIDTILINVTSFFRDPESWAYLREHVLPKIVADATASSRPIRVWSAGCASGEEAYTLAMMLAESMGPDDYYRRVKIYATDWDNDALVRARQARYSSEQLEPVPAALRRRYFTEVDNHATLDGMLRRSVIFGRHDLAADPPISRLDLLLCRNTLMYFTLPTQARVLGKLHFALTERGYLFLGRAEMLLSHARFFTPLELKHRIFTRVSAAATRRTRSTDEGNDDMISPNARTSIRLRDAALDAGPVAQVVFDSSDRLALYNERAAVLFGLAAPDVGKRLQDLELSYRPAELRSMLDRAREHGGPVVSEVSRTLAGELQFLDVTLTLLYSDGEPLATSVTFDDVSRHHRMQENLQQFSENLETAYEELQSANEELETTNEELQSANEELETTNEELQAANEEMETINEELRSTNEELQAANGLLRSRERDLDLANGFLQAIVGSLSSGVVVVDGECRVQVWNARAEELWGLRNEEVQGQLLTSLDIGLPVAQLAEPLRGALATGEVVVVVLEAVNRRGRALRCKVTISPLPGTKPAAATLLMDAVAEQGD